MTSTSTSTSTFSIEALIDLTQGGDVRDLVATINAGPAAVHALWHDLGQVWADAALGGTVPEPPDALDIVAAIVADRDLAETGDWLSDETAQWPQHHAAWLV